MDHKHTRARNYNIDALAILNQFNLFMNLRTALKSAFYRESKHSKKPLHWVLNSYLLRSRQLQRSCSIVSNPAKVRLGSNPDSYQQSNLAVPCNKTNNQPQAGLIQALQQTCSITAYSRPQTPSHMIYRSIHPTPLLFSPDPSSDKFVESADWRIRINY